MSEIDLTAPEVKKAIDAAVAKAVEEATSPLIAKRDELLGEVKKLRKGAEIKPEELEALEAQIETLKSENSKLSKEAKSFKSDLEKAQTAYQSENAFTQKLLVDNGLTAALVEAGVKEPAHLKAVKAMLATQVKVEIDGDNRVAKMGDKALIDAVKDWANSDEGKHFVSAPNNSGGGAQGGGSKGGGKQMTRAQFDALNPVEQASAIKGGSTITD